MDCVNIFTLGGLREVNENILIIEINSNIFVFDVDAKYLFNEGVNYIIADFDYLKKNKDKIKAYIITHCKVEKSVILYYFLSTCPATVYCTEITKIFIDFFFKKNNFNIEVNYSIVKPDSSVKISDYSFLFFNLCHNTPNSFGVMIETDMGNIVYMSDFIISNNNFDNFNGINSINHFSTKDNLILICDSFLAKKSGYTAPKCFLTTFIEDKIKNFSQDKKIIISVFSKNIFAITEIIKMANKYNRKICFYDNETSDLFKCLSNINGLIPVEIFTSNTIEKNNNVLILIAGSEKNIFNKINNFSKTSTSSNDDMFIIASPPNDSLELFSVSIKDNLIKNGFEVINLSSKEYLEMHPSCEDLKNVISIFKPKYYLPIKGYYRDMIANAKIANSTNHNLTGKNIFILENGNVLKIENGIAKILPNNQNIKTGSFLIEGNLMNNEANFDKRTKIAENGVLIVNTVIDLKKNKIAVSPKVSMLGFDSSMIKVDFLLKMLSNRIMFTLQKKCSLDIIKKNIIDFLNVFFTKEVKINQIPTIIPIVKNLV